MKQIFLVLLTVFLFQKASSMKPYRPDIFKFTDASKNHELQLPMDSQGQMIDVASKKVLISSIPKRISPHFVMTNPVDGSLILIGGLGDSGSELGSLRFIDLKGQMTSFSLEKFIPDLEKMSKESQHLTNFPWVSGLHITDQNLFIWICDQVEAEISLKDHSVQIHKTKPAWLPSREASHGSDLLLTPEAQKNLWAPSFQD